MCNLERGFGHKRKANRDASEECTVYHIAVYIARKLAAKTISGSTERSATLTQRCRLALAQIIPWLSSSHLGATRSSCAGWSVGEAISFSKKTA